MKENKNLAAAVSKAEEQQANLLAYYKARIEDFEKERGELLDKVGECTVQAGDVHRLDWECRKRDNDVRQLQKDLSDAHVFLFEERQRLLALQAENDELRLQEIEDRRKIQQLLAAQPGSSGLAQPSVDHLLLKIESLQAQLTEQKQLASERIAALLEDRRIREAEEASHRAHTSQQLQQAADKLKKTEELLRQTTKDFIIAKRDKQAAEQRMQEAEAAAAQERLAAAEQLTQIKRQATEDLHQTKQQSDSKMADVTTNLRRQLKAKEDELVNLTSVHTTMSSQYEKRIGELETRVAKLAEQNKQLELRRHMDMEGYTNDVTALRKQLTAVDRKLHEMRLVERLEEDDRLDTILEHLRKKAPSTAPTPDTSDTATQRSEPLSAKAKLAEGLKDIRGRIRGLEDKLAAKRKLLATHK